MISQRKIQKETNTIIEEKGTQQSRNVQVFFVIDVSSSMSGRRIKNTIAGMKQIYDRLEDHDRLSIFYFSTEVGTLVTKQKQFLSWDRLASDLESKVGGATAMNDAIIDCMKFVPYDNSSLRQFPQREMVVFTDGEDNSSSNSYNTLRNFLSTRTPDDFERKNLNITMIACGISTNYRNKLENLCSPSHCTYLPCEDAGDAIQKTFRKASKSIIIRRTEIVTISEIDIDFQGLSISNIRSLPATQLPALTNGSPSISLITSPRTSNSRGSSSTRASPAKGNNSRGSSITGASPARGNNSNGGNRGTSNRGSSNRGNNSRGGSITGASPAKGNNSRGSNKPSSSNRGKNSQGGNHGTSKNSATRNQSPKPKFCGHCGSAKSSRYCTSCGKA